MILNLRNRIRKAQARSGEGLHHIAELIQAGAYYDAITDEEKEMYAEYRAIDRASLEELELLTGGSLHFKLERKPAPPTREQFSKNLDELEKIVDKYIEEYNAPEEVAKREAEYQELQRIGALRKAAYLNGESMDVYPLPWEKGES